MRYATCLTVAPTVMDATHGGSGGIPSDPNLATGRDKAKTLEGRRQRFWWIRKKGTQITQDLEEKEAVKILLQKIRSYETLRRSPN